MTDICTKCNENQISQVRVVMYYANGKPIYYKLCDPCIRAKWEGVRVELQKRKGLNAR